MSVMYLYLNMSCTVKWKKSMSSAFDISNGTKQGGILSPNFFAMYMHDLIEILKACGFGCLVIQLCIACLFFADDLVLCSPSRFGLQQLLNICAAYCKKFCLDFNVKKYKYLGVDLCAGKELSFSPITTIRSFHKAANAILYSRVKPSNDVLMKLLYSN